MNDLLSALRHATRDAHSQLDHHPVLAQLLASELSLERYAEVLLLLYPAHAGMEDVLTEYWCKAPVSYDLHRREALLRSDLKQLGHHPAEPSRWPAPQSFSAAVGMTYVIEGSRLGGTMLARRIMRQLPDAPCRFFAEDGSQQWSAFQKFVLQHQQLIDHNEAITAALKGFDCYRTVINLGYPEQTES
ncbi:biliverdin-producing heme oxygenase [Pseudidiomarina halophila]|uniref:Heme oxygenase n=1 Tax=Pseudidiomarina halophila TaxID=1449799 RepID=A0A432XTC1_9GAMM|nr:biliverdin-producing heme oxygenase [Pseudidiomarina halophila]RUO51976.1 hypothetical protein CWI69_10060 [Pseudidiomarina halophila]